MGRDDDGRTTVVRRGKRARAAAVLLAATLAATPAAAVIKVATYTGTVFDGYDTTGEFGPAKTDLNGKTFVGRYVYDTSLGIRSTVAGAKDDVLGGAAYNATTPILLATVTIGGVSRSIDGINLGDAQVSYNYGAAELAANIQTDMSGYLDYQVSSYVGYGGQMLCIPASLDTSFALVGAIGTQYVQYLQYVSSYSFSGFSYYASAYADVRSLTVTNGAPEPAAWTLMIGGFGAVGAVERRRRVALA